MKKKGDTKTTAAKRVSTPGKGNISQELEDEIYEKRLLGKLDCLEKLNKSRSKRNIFIFHPNTGMLSQYKELALELERKFNVYGIQVRGLKPGGKMPETPIHMLKDYTEQILAFQKNGPYILAGFCGGNILAFEIGRILERQDQVVEKVILIDAQLIVSDDCYKWHKRLKYLPRFFEKLLIYDSCNAFLKVMRKNNYFIKDDDDAAVRKQKVLNYMNMFCDNPIIFGSINAYLQR